MSVPAIQMPAPPAAPAVGKPRKGFTVALLLSLALHAVVMLSLIEWFEDAPESPSIVRATLASANGRPAVSAPPLPMAKPQVEAAGPESLPDTSDTGRNPAAETPLRPAVSRVASTDETSSERNLDYTTALRQIADLDAREAGVQPRVRRIAEGRTETSEDDWYLESWRRKVERIGELNYPAQARARKIYGNLRLLVAIEPDGALREVRVIDSSGHKALDDAAVRIVRLAAPYAPFPPGMRADTDVLEIVRTWQFKKRGSISPT